MFQYEGRDRYGRKKTGKVSSISQRQAIVQLREQGVAVKSIQEMKGILYKEVSLGAKKVKTKDFVIYIRQFSTLLKAGISVVDCTRILSQQTTNKLLQQALTEIVEGLEEGNPFSELAERHRKVFPPFFTNMLKAGEAGGNLDEILDRLATYYEKQYKTIQKVKSAMTYPIFLGISSIGIVIFLLATVVPTFTDMFESFGSELPPVTRFVINVGDFVQSFWYLIILFGLLVYFGILYARRNKRSKYYLDYFLLKIPVIGKVFQQAALARMTRTLASLFSSSVPILQAISIVERIIENEVMAKVLRDSRISLESGQSLATPMQKHWVFPPMVSHMIVVGEKSGSLDIILDKVADYYEAEVDQITEQLKSLIEPIMIALLAVVVGTIVGSIAIPMFDIFNKIQ